MHDLNLIEEDMVVQACMGSILDRTQEFLSTSDLAVIHGRKMLLDEIAAYQSGKHPRGSALGDQAITVMNPIDAVLPPGGRWQDWSMAKAAA